ncbi:MAG TPA: exodeoxyribonuclease VII large subunit [Bacteroidales bacterium]|jgi:exodeoxyribonuclease VII large subunit|nr:exodeoxyribonuclease VII large subunit [Bacteroidales bacterium]
MPEKQLSLSQLSLLIKDIVNNALPMPIWVKAEISELHENRNGHCYLELIEKDALSNKITAKFRAIIWDRTYRMLKPYFETTTQSELKSGINVLILVKVEYSELYGISLTINDIDPAFTIGDLEMRRTMVIQQLIAEGVFEMNKELEFPLVPQRIAIISSETAAGYEDFCNQLNYNEYQFKYKIKLFKAYMQGEQAEQSIIEAMEKIPLNEYDLLVITRGGGSKSDLACFDGYDLSNNVAQFPLPVITAIGHERDTSVVDLVAHTRVKTPTAAAEFIIQKTADYWNRMLNMYENIAEYSNLLIEQEKNKIEQFIHAILNVKNIISIKKQQITYHSEKIKWQSHKIIKLQQQELSSIGTQFKTMAKHSLIQSRKRLNAIADLLLQQSNFHIKLEHQHLKYIEKNIDAYNPKHVLAKGYSITLINNQVIKSAKNIKVGDKIKTILKDGELISEIKNE